LLKQQLHQKGSSTVDWVRWRHNNTPQRGHAPRSCIGSRTF